MERFEYDTEIPDSKKIDKTFFDSAEFPVEWELVWEDTRYRDGRIPIEEQEYLMEGYAQFPKDPPVAPG